MNPERVMIFDTTLRDGEQCPGASMSLDEKMMIAGVLDRMGVDIVEAGFPASSNGAFEAVHAIASSSRNAIVCALSRAQRGDVERAAEALAPARRKRIHTFISTSPLHMHHKLQMTSDQVHEAIIDSVRLARKLCDDVEWSCEDGTRSDPEFLCRCFEAAIKAGATTVNIADTVGFIMPNEFASLIRMLRERVPGMDKVRFSVHCHDDLGLATANSLAAIGAGARQVECTVNGIGERAGNASLEEIVMALHTRTDFLACRTGIDTRYLTELSRLVSGITGFAVPPNKAIVGSNAFAHEAGIHQHGVLRHRGTYEIMEPTAVGAAGSKLIMGRHSGRHALRAKLEELGYAVGENAIEVAFDKFKQVADLKKEVTDDDLVDLMREIQSDELHSAKDDRIRLDDLTIASSLDGTHRAEVKLTVSGEPRSGRGQDASAVSAIAAAIRNAFDHSVRLELVHFHALSQDAAPQVKATIRLADEEGSAVGQGSDPDPNIACARAYLNALNRRIERSTGSPAGRRRS